MSEPTIPDLRTSTAADLRLDDPDEPIGVRIRAFFGRLGVGGDRGLTHELERLAQTCDGAASPYHRAPGSHPLCRGRVALAVSSYQGQTCALLGVEAQDLARSHAVARQRLDGAAQATGVSRNAIVGSMAANFPVMVATRWQAAAGGNDGMVDAYAETLLSYFPPEIIAGVLRQTALQDCCFVMAMIVSPTAVYAGALPLARFDDLVGPAA